MIKYETLNKHDSIAGGWRRLWRRHRTAELRLCWFWFWKWLHLCFWSNSF